MPKIMHKSLATVTMRFKHHEIAIIEITPRIARDWLANNTNNRPKSEAVVLAYKADLQNGDWPFTGDAIRFHKDGTLLDGQHRLTAISREPDGFSVSLLCVFGLDDDAMMVLDQGKKRTPGDQLAITRNLPNATLVAATVKHLLIAESGAMFKDRTKIKSIVTNSKIMHWVDENAELVSVMQDVFNDARSSLVPPSVISAAATMFATIDEELAREYVKKLATGENLHSGSPLLALRTRSINQRVNGKKDTDRDLFGLILKTFWDEYGGKKKGKVQLPKGGTYSTDTFPSEILNAYLDYQNK